MAASARPPRARPPRRRQPAKRQGGLPDVNSEPPTSNCQRTHVGSQAAGIWPFGSWDLGAVPRRPLLGSNGERMALVQTPVDRAAAAEWYARNRRRTRAIFDLIDPAAYYTRPISLRNPVVFYEGHLP